MTQEHLNSMAIMSIEQDIIQSLDYSQFIADFTAIKARKVDFRCRFVTSVSVCLYIFQLFVYLDINKGSFFNKLRNFIFFRIYFIFY